MQRFGIRWKILLLAALPAILIGTALAIYHTLERVADLEISLRTHGTGIVRHLAPASEYEVFAGNRDMLRGLSAAIMEETQVRSVTIFDVDGHVLARNGPAPLPHLASAPTGTSPSVTTSRNGETLLFTAYIYPTEIAVDIEPGARVAADAPSKHLGWVQVELSRVATIKKRNQILLHSLVLVGLATVLVVLIAWIVSHRVVTPVLELTDAVERMQQGDLGARVTESAADEMRTLQHGFNAMAETQQASQVQLQERVAQATRELRKTLGALEIKNLELEHAQKKAIAANQSKSEFLAFISHEVRTPLTGVVGYCKLLLKTALTRRQQEYATTVEHSAQDLLKIINELLDISKLEAGKFIMDEEDFDLRDCIADVLATVAPQAEQKELEMAAVVESTIPQRLRGDPARLRQVLLNLVSNGVTFTPRGSVFVRVSPVELDAGAVVLHFSVIDTGTGMGKSAQARLFNAYAQGDDASGHAEGSTGLGLLISKRLVEQMNGDIGVKSTPGEGSEFWFRVRLSMAAVAAAADGLESALAGKHARVCAHHAFTRLALREILSGWDMQVTEATGLQAPLPETGASDSPDVWILDLSREPDALARMKELHAQDAPACLMLLSMSVAESLQERPDDKPARLAKPVRPAALRTELARLLGTPVRRPEAPLISPVNRIEKGYTPRVLVLEDDTVSRQFVTGTLEDHGARVSTATSIKQAVAKLKYQTFDAIVLDMHLPDGSGADLAARLRKQPEYTTTTILGLTAEADEDVRQATLRRGVDEVLFKPVDPDILWDNVLMRTGKQIGEKASKGQGPEVDGLQGDLTTLLRDDIPLHRRELESAVRDHDFARVASIAHTVAGGAAFCQASELRDAAEALQAAARDEDPSTLAESLALVHQAMENLLSASD